MHGHQHLWQCRRARFLPRHDKGFYSTLYNIVCKRQPPIHKNAFQRLGVRTKSWTTLRTERYGNNGLQYRTAYVCIFLFVVCCLFDEIKEKTLPVCLDAHCDESKVAFSSDAICLAGLEHTY